VIGSRRIFAGIGHTAHPPAFSVCGGVIPSFFQELLTHGLLLTGAGRSSSVVLLDWLIRILPCDLTVS
jgi:hypothetical protein